MLSMTPGTPAARLARAGQLGRAGFVFQGVGVFRVVGVVGLVIQEDQPTG